MLTIINHDAEGWLHFARMFRSQTFSLKAIGRRVRRKRKAIRARTIRYIEPC